MPYCERRQHFDEMCRIGLRSTADAEVVASFDVTTY